jgi:plastocyanin
MRSTFRPHSPSNPIPVRPAGWRANPRVRRLLLFAGFAALASGCGGRAAATHALHRVVIRGFKFDPASLSIAVGDTVEWLNADLVPHTSTSSSGRWNSNSIVPDSSWRAVLTTPGSEPYGCQLHPNMRAQLEVR